MSMHGEENDLQKAHCILSGVPGLGDVSDDSLHGYLEDAKPRIISPVHATGCRNRNITVTCSHNDLTTTKSRNRQVVIISHRSL